MTTSARSKLYRVSLSALAVVAIGGAAVGCSSDSTSSTSTSGAVPNSSISVNAQTTIIDVRTPSEFAAGHLEGAQNIDVQSSDFDSQISGLDKNASYVVYCRSGNRSAAAADRMQAAGFTNVQDAGSLEDASASTGIVIVN